MKAATLPRPSATPPTGSLKRTTGPARRSHWTPEEDEILSRCVHQFEGKSWKKIAEFLPGRNKVQCLHRWQKVLDPELVKGSWSKKEDGIIVEMVHKYGPKKWSTIAQALPGRIGKQCRERWYNHLNPSIKKEAWTQEEEITLINAHAMLGNKWVELTKCLPGRCENSIKNHWNCSVKNKVNLYAAMGLLEYPPPLPLPCTEKENTLHPPVQEIPNSNNPSSSCLNPPQGSQGRGMLFSPSMAMSSPPFVSYDYVNSGDVLQEEYSPLGIRQWIASSDLYSPDSSQVWCMQSASSEKKSSPEELLKSAAKTKSFNSKRRQGMLFSPSPLQDKRGNALHTKGTELEIDTTALQDNPPDKENIPPDSDPGSGSKTSPINIPEGATETSGGVSDSNGISCTLKKRKRKYIPGSGSGGTNSTAIEELQLFADALLAEDPDFFREESVLIENFQDQRWFSPAKLLKKS
ncbi:transcription factor [Carex littledalei]|uniref:Transcription factor n=1 Tax=Carex littledalei TaxID=544730 RepID=A0A833VJA4_9POAL|nr:transcription factor [Carex littledalei]